MVSAKVEESMIVEICQEEPDFDIKPELANVSPLAVNKNGKRSTDLADAIQSSEQDDCRLEADDTDKEEVTGSLTASTPVQLSQRKCAQQRKSGLNFYCPVGKQNLVIQKIQLEHMTLILINWQTVII